MSMARVHCWDDIAPEKVTEMMSRKIVTGGGTSHTSHLGGLVVGYLYLKGGISGFIGEIKYQYIKWKMRRLRSRFGVHPGRRQDDWDRRIH